MFCCGFSQEESLQHEAGVGPVRAAGGEGALGV